VTITTKKGFIAAVKTMASPCLKEITLCDWDLLSLCFVIEDRDNIRNKFCTRSVKLGNLEYLGDCTNGGAGHEGYFNREEKLRKQINGWFNEAIRHQ